MAKAFLIDTTVCTGCRGCQIACKQWHDLPAEETKNVGSYQNPQDLSFDTYKLVRMREEVTPPVGTGTSRHTSSVAC